MIQEQDRQLYKKLSILFGAFPECIQGAGGNISIKSNSQILLKSSGTCLSETSDTDGFVICDRHSLSIIEGTGKPSMEFGFHLLPKRIIVHFHPLSLLSGFIPKTSESILTVPYIQPGDSLAQFLQTHYSNQSIIYLTSHGIIFLADTEEEILRLLHCVYDASFCRTFHILNDLYEHTACSILTSRCSTRHAIFQPYTPDFFLFLKKKSLAFNASESVQSQYDSYVKRHGFPPSVIYIEKYVFCIASSWKKALTIRDILEGYCYVEETRKEPIITLTSTECQNLLQCEKEAYRLR